MIHHRTQDPQVRVAHIVTRIVDKEWEKDACGMTFNYCGRWLEVYEQVRMEFLGNQE